DEAAVGELCFEFRALQLLASRDQRADVEDETAVQCFRQKIDELGKPFEHGTAFQHLPAAGAEDAVKIESRRAQIGPDGDTRFQLDRLFAGEEIAELLGIGGRDLDVLEKKMILLQRQLRFESHRLELGL